MIHLTRLLATVALAVASAVAFAVALAHPVLAAEPKLCFQRGTSVYVASVAGAKPVRVVAANAYDARLSPDGTTVAHTLDVTRKNEPPTRHVAVTDIATRKTRRLASIPGSNNYRPIWSPDGSKLMFQHYTGKRWEVAVVAPDDTGFAIVSGRVGDPEDAALTGAFWAPDGRTLYLYDFTSLYHVALDGEVLDKRPIEGLVKELSTGYAFALAPDGNRLLVETLEEVADIELVEGPPTIVYLVDLSTGERRRVSPKGMNATSPVWAADGKAFFFEGRKGVYRMTLDGAAKLVVANASSPSLSR